MVVRTGWIVGIAVSAQLLAAGCGKSGGDGLLGSLFGGGDSSSSDVFDLLGSGGSGDGGSGSGLGSGSGAGSAGSGGSGSGSGGAGSVHMPEPASVALFGGGLAGVALLRRRSRKRSR